jgi:hypothetical protein
MAKKVRRVKKKRKRKDQATSSSEETTAAASTTEAPAESQLSSADQFRLDYAYVVKDLRRVLILAAIMFALLIVTNLLLQ